MDYQETMNNIKEERKKYIVERATELYMERGIYEVSMGDVALECKVGTASLYRYYGTKNGLVIQCAELVWQRLLEYIQAKISDKKGKQAKEEVADILNIFLHLYKDKPKELRLIKTFDDYICKQETEKEQMKEYELKVELFYQAFAKVYQEGIETESIVPKENGVYEFLAVIHILFCMCQKFAGENITSHDGNERSDFELETIISLYTKEI